MYSRTAPARARGLSPSRAAALFLSSVALLAGCMIGPASDGEEAATPIRAVDDAKIHRQQGNPDVPLGCSKVWSYAAADSVLDCPDIRPGIPVLKNP